MRQALAALAIGGTLLLNGCATPGGAPPTTADIIKQVQQASVVACGFLPLAATVAAIISSGTLSGPFAIASAICAAVTSTGSLDGGLRRSATPPRVAGVVIQGRFVR